MGDLAESFWLYGKDATTAFENAATGELLTRKAGDQKKPG
jgi:hypothetical protein